jgi:hypothetical protein
VQVVVARGGAGGRGNASIQPNRRLDPKGDWVMPSELSGTAGGPGSVGELRLELKVLADVGMVVSGVLVCRSKLRDAAWGTPGTSGVDNCTLKRAISLLVDTTASEEGGVLHPGAQLEG